MILDYIYWLLSGYSWALSRLCSIAAILARHCFTSTMSVQDTAAERDQVQEERNGVKRSSCACAEASHEMKPPRTNVFQGVSAAEDADQVIISTNNDLISATQVTAALRARQWVGQMNDASLQQLLLQTRRTNSGDPATTNEPVEPEVQRAVNFVRYGAGFRLDSGGPY